MKTQYLSNTAKIKVLINYAQGVLLVVFLLLVYSIVSDDDFNEQNRASQQVKENAQSVKRQLIAERKAAELDEYILLLRAEDLTGIAGVKKGR